MDFRWLVLLFCLVSPVEPFYLPGVSPRTFKDGESVNIKVQTLFSSESQLQFDYYQLPFCKPKKIVDLPENLGEAVAGEKAHNSLFKAKMKVNEYCKTVCRKDYTPAQMEEFQDFSILDYRVNMRLDNLPVAEIAKFYYEDRPEETLETYNLGFPVGSKLHEEVHTDEAVTEHYVLNNHLRFKILYHSISKEKGFNQMAQGSKTLDGQDNLIVGFHVHPYSIAHTYQGEWKESCAPNCPLTSCLGDGMFAEHSPQKIEPSKGGAVIWTYDIVWEESEIMWASRWDVYLRMTDDRIHWFSIINSFVILLFLAGIVGMIFSRVLRNDLSRYNDELEGTDATALREESGWKLLHGDIFRAPPNSTLLSVYVATGVQLLIMAFITLVLAALGFLSPSHRGSLLTAVIVLFMLTGVGAGYVAARLSKLLQEEDKVRVTYLTATVFPLVCALAFLLLNTLIWAQGSSGAVPFGTLIAIILLWFCLSLPLVFLGAYLGYRAEALTVPCRTNPIPREIPQQLWYLRSLISILVGGLLPFGAVFVEMFFILSSIWQHRFYYLFGFLFLVFLVLIASSAMICMILCYLHLCAEDYRWWWRSMFTGGSIGLYLLAYGAYHYFARTHKAIDVLSSIIYFGYLGLVSYAFAVMMAAVGFLSCFFFIVKIYSSVKID